MLLSPPATAQPISQLGGGELPALPTAPQSSARTTLGAPSIPDDLPFFPTTHENPRIHVTFDDGSPITGAVHRGDVLLVHGVGFSPQANQGGFPLPIPPGVPNGVWVLYSGFPAHWKPSEGAPAANRKQPHDEIAWVMPHGSLEAIPAAPIDFRRTIAREAQTMNDDGTFTARITVDPPKHTAGDNFGVYVYAAGGSINPAEEFYVPIPFSPDPGLHTPPAPTPDLKIRAPWLQQATGIVKGGVKASDGADYTDDGTATFSEEPQRNDGVRRFTGTITATAKFNVVDVAVRNPWLTPLGNGRWLLSAEVSRGSVGTDDMQRLNLGVVDTTGGLVTMR